jgi:hypothetical protein
LPLGLLGLCLASAGCVGFAVGDRDAAAEMDSDPGAFGGYFDGGPARDYRFRGAASRGASAEDRATVKDPAVQGN